MSQAPHRNERPGQPVLAEPDTETLRIDTTSRANADKRPAQRSRHGRRVRGDGACPGGRYPQHFAIQPTGVHVLHPFGG